MRSLRLFGLAATLALSVPASASDNDIPMLADRFVGALQAQHFDEAAAMFRQREGHAATATELQRIATRIGGFSTMRNVLSLPSGTTLRRELPSNAPLVPKPKRYHQVNYAATAADGQPVYYIVTLDAGKMPQPVLWFEVQFPTPDAAARARAEGALHEVFGHTQP